MSLGLSSYWYDSRLAHLAYFIQDLAGIISQVVGFGGILRNNTEKPDGTPRKMLDSSRLTALGWQPSWSLTEGIADAYEWFVNNEASLRSV
mgnify:CR=1 FL=1